MSELGEKVKTSIERLKAFEPQEGYHLAFSGGKDSVVCKALLEMSGCKFDSSYRITSVDPPELVQFIKERHPDVKLEYPRYSDGTVATMWNLIPKNKIPPTHLMRYCCKALKESGGDGRMTVTGVRWAESVNRQKNQGMVTVMGKKAGKELADNPDFAAAKRGGVVLVNDNTDSRRMVEFCYKRHKTNVNPIIEWTNADVWDFIRSEGISYCGLYDDGFHRLGCIGCPLGGQHGREREFLRWPKYKAMYLRAFQKMLDERAKSPRTVNNKPWQTPMEVFNWWMQYDDLPGQIDLLENEDG